jgi:hypothetical protein
MRLNDFEQKMIKKAFIEKLYECNQHKKRLLSAKNRLKAIMPLSLKRYNELDEMTISIIDQMIFRFSKLQDSMGEKIFPNILELAGENIKKMTFIDRLNRLEELGLIDREKWMSLRKERNEIAHEYSFNQDEVVDSINLIFERVDELIDIYMTFCKYSFEKFDFVQKNNLVKCL